MTSMPPVPHENPYQSTPLSGATSPNRRVIRSLWWAIYLHPVIVLILLYASWTVTAAALGRRPGMGEHPENDWVHGAVHFLEISAALLTLAAPILIPFALMSALAQPFASHQMQEPVMKRVVCLATYLLMLSVVVAVYYFDPFGAVCWFWD